MRTSTPPGYVEVQDREMVAVVPEQVVRAIDHAMASAFGPNKDAQRVRNIIIGELARRGWGFSIISTDG